MRNHPPDVRARDQLSPPFIQRDGRPQFSAVVDRRDTLPRHASPSCGSIHSRNEIGTTGAGAIIWKLYSFLLSDADIVRRRVIDRLFGDTRLLEGASLFPFIGAFCKRIIIP